MQLEVDRTALEGELVVVLTVAGPGRAAGVGRGLEAVADTEAGAEESGLAGGPQRVLGASSPPMWMIFEGNSSATSVKTFCKNSKLLSLPAQKMESVPVRTPAQRSGSSSSWLSAASTRSRSRAVPQRARRWPLPAEAG